MFISFEGIDGCGKSTQVSLLERALVEAGHSVRVLREPGATPLSEAVRSVLLNSAFDIDSMSELLLFCAARRQLVETVIRPALDNGTIVICDRYADSSTAYQGYGRGLALDDVASANRLATGGLMPHCTFFLDISVTESLQRSAKRSGTSPDRMERSGDAFFERVRSGYQSIANSEDQRFLVLDGTQSIEFLHQSILDRTMQCLASLS